MRNLTFLKHAGVYAIGDFLVMAAGFVLLPLYTRSLTQTQFGTLEILERTGEILVVCLLGRGIPQAVFALSKQCASEIERRQIVGAAFSIAAVTIGLGTLGLWPVADSLSAWLQVDSGLLLWTAMVVMLLDGFSLVALTLNQARLDSVFYAAVSLSQFLMKIVLSIVFVAVLGWGIWGVVAASLVRSVLFAVFLLQREWRLGMAWPDWTCARELLAFALPFIPTGLCFFVLNSADRFFLIRCTDQTEVGIYGLGYRLATLVGLFTITPLFRVWSARMYDVGDRPDAASIFGRVFTYVLGAYLFLGLGLCLLQDAVIVAFAGPAYVAAGAVVAPVVLAYSFMGASVLMDSAFYLRRQTGKKLWIALASTALMLLLYAWLIPAYGALGAAWATLLGFVFHALLTGWVAQRVFAVRYEGWRLAALFCSVGAIWFMGQYVGPGYSFLPVKFALWLSWPVLLWILGIVRPEERQMALVGMRSVLASLGLCAVREYFPLSPCTQGERGWREGVADTPKNLQTQARTLTPSPQPSPPSTGERE
jgi:O-antigen/teichoic acid export membrane protein